jgi:hypothetical protein
LEQHVNHLCPHISIRVTSIRPGSKFNYSQELFQIYFIFYKVLNGQNNTLLPIFYNTTTKNSGVWIQVIFIFLIHTFSIIYEF